MNIFKFTNSPFLLLLLLLGTIFDGSKTIAQQILKEEAVPSTQARDNLLERASTQVLSAEQTFALAVEFLAIGEFTKAEIVARLGLGLANPGKEKAALYAVIALSNGGLSDFKAAAQAALEGQRQDPVSKELAGLRVFYFSRTGDKAQRMAAEDTLMDLAGGGKPVLSMEDVKAGIGFAVTIYSLFKSAYDLTEPWLKEHKNELQNAVKQVLAMGRQAFQKAR